MTKPAGLYRKFIVERADGSSGPGGKHEHCDYFVLDWRHDKYARTAALAYAKACEAEYPELARDLRDRSGMEVAHMEPPRRTASPSTEARVCGSCPHPPHLGPCTRRNGQTANPCPCLRDTLPRPRVTVTPGFSAFLRGDLFATDEAAPQPIERCSCAESIRLRAALEQLIGQVLACRANPVAIGNYGDVVVLLDTFERIARSALSLEPERTE